MSFLTFTGFTSIQDISPHLGEKVTADKAIWLQSKIVYDELSFVVITIPIHKLPDAFLDHCGGLIVKLLEAGSSEKATWSKLNIYR